MKYSIENGVPIPPKQHIIRAKSVERLTLDSLKVGQSILFDMENMTVKNLPVFGIKGKKFTTRQVDKTHVRVWRLE